MPGDSPDATKTWVDARISIAPNATNEVGQPHTFTVTLRRTPAPASCRRAGEHVDVTLTDSNGAVALGADGHVHERGANTNATGQCTITFTSHTAGKVTGHASVDADGRRRRRSRSQTDGVGAELGRRGEDVRRREHPDHAADGDEPGRHEPHADGARQRERRHGRLRERAGRDDDHAARSSPGPATLVDAERARRSAATGIVHGDDHVGRRRARRRSSATRRDGRRRLAAPRRPVTRTRATAPNATKTWVNARISIAPNATNEVGQPHTFTVTLEKDTGTRLRARRPGEHVDCHADELERRGAVLDAAASTCDDAGANTNAAGQCTITFTSPTRGQGDRARDVDAVGRRLGARSRSQTNGVGAELRPTR